MEHETEKQINNLLLGRMMVDVLTDKTFQQAINGSLPVIIDFWAEWCGPCKMLAPVFEAVSKEYAGKLKFGKLSTEDYPDIAEGLAIFGIPCLILFKNSKEVDRIVGFHQAEALKKKIDLILSKI